MSGLAKGIKKAAKKVGKFLRRYWKVIVIAALIVLTAGIATVGVAGFSSAAAAAGGGFAGTMSAVGSTMVAGAAAIGGSVGIGSGVTASTAGGAFAAAPAVQGAMAASGGAMGATLGTGAAAQAMGFAPAAANYAAAAQSAGGFTAAGTPGYGVMANAATPGAASAAGFGNIAGTAGATNAGMGNAIGAGGGGGSAGSASGGGVLSRFMDSNAAGPVLQAGIQGVGSYMQQRSIEEQMQAQRPRGYWGVGVGDEPDPSLTPEQMNTAPDGPMWTTPSFDPPEGVPGLMNRPRMTPQQLAYIRRGGFRG